MKTFNEYINEESLINNPMGVNKLLSKSQQDDIKKEPKLKILFDNLLYKHDNMMNYARQFLTDLKKEGNSIVGHSSKLEREIKIFWKDDSRLPKKGHWTFK